MGATTKTETLEVLLLGFGSVWSAETVAVLVIVPAATGSVRIVTVTVHPFATVPSWHVTTPPASEHVPCVEVEERYVVVEGSVSCTVTVVADAGPLLVTVSV